jgi:hypothetical protein
MSPPPVALVLDATNSLPLRVAVEMSLGGARVFCGLRLVESRNHVESAAANKGTAVESIVVDPNHQTSCVRHVVERAGRIDLLVVPGSFPKHAVLALVREAAAFGPCRVVRLQDDGALVPFHAAPLRAAA